MIRKLLVAGLVAGFALLASLPEAQARHCRRVRTCCQGVGYNVSYQQPIASVTNACNTQPAQGFQGNGFQNGQNQSGYQPNAYPAPDPGFRDSTNFDNPNQRNQQPPQPQEAQPQPRQSQPQPRQQQPPPPPQPQSEGQPRA